MENNGNNIKWPTFNLIVGIFIIVMGSIFGLLWTGINDIRVQVVELKVDMAGVKADLNSLTKQVEQQRKPGESSYESLLRLVGVK